MTLALDDYSLVGAPMAALTEDEDEAVGHPVMVRQGPKMHAAEAPEEAWVIPRMDAMKEELPPTTPSELSFPAARLPSPCLFKIVLKGAINLLRITSTGRCAYITHPRRLG